MPAARSRAIHAVGEVTVGAALGDAVEPDGDADAGDRPEHERQGDVRPGQPAAPRDRDGEDVVDTRPAQVLLHLADSAASDRDRGRHVEGV